MWTALPAERPLQAPPSPKHGESEPSPLHDLSSDLDQPVLRPQIDLVRRREELQLQTSQVSTRNEIDEGRKRSIFAADASKLGHKSDLQLKLLKLTLV